MTGMTLPLRGVPHSPNPQLGHVSRTPVLLAVKHSAQSAPAVAVPPGLGEAAGRPTRSSCYSAAGPGPRCLSGRVGAPGGHRPFTLACTARLPHAGERPGSWAWGGERLV